MLPYSPLWTLKSLSLFRNLDLSSDAKNCDEWTNNNNNPDLILKKELDKRFTQHRIDSSCRFIQNHNLRFMQKRNGKRNFPLNIRRAISDRRWLVSRQTKGFGQIRDAIHHVGLPHPQQSSIIVKNLVGGETWVEAEGLGRIAHSYSDQFVTGLEAKNLTGQSNWFDYCLLSFVLLARGLWSDELAPKSHAELLIFHNPEGLARHI